MSTQFELASCPVERIAIPRSYLAVGAATAPDATIEELKELTRRAAPYLELPLCMGMVIDGGPEYCHEVFSRPLPNHDACKALVERKDSLFYRFCAAIAAHQDGIVLDRFPASPYNIGTSYARRFQDACVCAFPAQTNGIHAIQTALRVRQSLTHHNMSILNLPWNEQLHARIVIAPSWDEVVRNLPHTWRDDVMASSECLANISVDCKKLCYILGVKPIV
jgi:hypothetical protein